MSARSAALPLGLACILLTGCTYLRLLRPSVIGQLNPRVARLVNYMPAVDHPNEATVARLVGHGGLSHAEEGDDGVMRAFIRIPRNEFIWAPAVIVAPHGGTLELEVYNEDKTFHIAMMPSTGSKQILELPARTAGVLRIELDQPGLYSFACPVANHAGRGMLGLIFVEGEVPPEARLDRPPQRRPRG